MGFLGAVVDIVKNVGVAVADELQSNANESRAIRQNYREMEDHELIKILNNEGVFGNSKKERGIAYRVLLERGYSEQDMKKE